MTNNDVLRRLRYTFDYGDDRMIAIFRLGGMNVSRQTLSNWLKKDDHPDFTPCEQEQLAAFLNGLIIYKRGPKEGAGPQPHPEPPLSNNGILRKLKIALSFKELDMLEVMNLGGMPLSRPELSAFFRKEDHRHFRACQDQILRHFLRGLQSKLRDGEPAESANE